MLQSYYDSLGGRPTANGNSNSKKRKGRKSAAGDSPAPPVATSSKRARKEREWSPPPGSWENDVDYIETVEQSETIEKETGEPTKYAYLTWNNGKKTQHPLRYVYQKCPQKMLLYYESHLYVGFQYGCRSTDTV
jgi:chromobox protein 1